MTNERAIEILNSLKDYYNDRNVDSYVGFDDEDNEALDMAIKALEQQPKTGHWITDVYMFGRGRHTCSNCGKGQEYTTAFCSWCGADMRGDT